MPDFNDEIETFIVHFPWRGVSWSIGLHGLCPVLNYEIISASIENGVGDIPRAFLSVCKQSFISELIECAEAKALKDLAEKD